MIEGSIMPAYPWLAEKKTDIKALPKKIAVQRRLGVPFPTMTQHEIEQNAIDQATGITSELRETDKIFVEPDRQIIAVIAYLQKLGRFEEIPADEKTDNPRALSLPDARRPAPETDTSASPNPN